MDESLLRVPLAIKEQKKLQKEILNGAFGKPGDLFLTTRDLAEARHISLVTAHHVLTGLVDSGYIELKGKKYILSYSGVEDKRKAKRQTIGVIMPRLDNEFYSSIADAAVSAALKEGYHIVFMSTLYDIEEEEKAVRELNDFKVSGIISCLPTRPEALSIYQNLSIPCVLLGHSLDKSKISSVQVNSFSISQKVAQYLIEEGYRSFIYVGTKNIPLESDIRYTAYKMELKQLGYLLCDEDIIRISTDGKDDDETHLFQIIREASQPLGVFCFHDLIAAKVYSICNKLGKKIPEDVGVIGFDNLSIAKSIYPSLTSVQYRIGTMAEMAVNLLLEKIRHGETAYDNYYIEPNLVIRDSAALSKTT